MTYITKIILQMFNSKIINKNYPQLQKSEKIEIINKIFLSNSSFNILINKGISIKSF